MSAPARKLSCLSEVSTTARTSGSSASSPKKIRSKSATTSGVSLLTGSPWRFKERTATSSSWVTVQAVIGSYPFQHQRKPHPARSTDRHQSKLDITPDHLIRNGRDDARSGRPERVPDRDR